MFLNNISPTKLISSCSLKFLQSNLTISQHLFLCGTQLKCVTSSELHHNNPCPRAWACKSTSESRSSGAEPLVWMQQGSLLLHAVPQHLLAFVPGADGVIMWVCLIAAIVRSVRRPIVLLCAELRGESLAGPLKMQRLRSCWYTCACVPLPLSSTQAGAELCS